MCFLASESLRSWNLDPNSGPATGDEFSILFVELSNFLFNSNNFRSLYFEPLLLGIIKSIIIVSNESTLSLL